MFSLGFEPRSGRIISLGRFMLVSVFLLAIWLDETQPVRAEQETYGIVLGYVLVSLGLAIATWNDWWLDVRLAGAAHMADVGLFTLLVLLTESYTSPFFLFFVFLLLSAAIRWGWRETALTAAALILLYITAGILIAGSPEFEIERFIIRSGHLFILSGIVIWFGINQGFLSPVARARPFAPVPPDEPPLETALVEALSVAKGKLGSLLWRDDLDGKGIALSFANDKMKIGSSAAPLLRDGSDARPFLYDLRRNRAVSRNHSREFRLARADDWMKAEGGRRIGLREGLAIPVAGESGRGELYIEGIRGLSVDHIELGQQLAREVADHLRRHALLRAVEESGEARARLSLARDLHDSIVQFLAGATFRIEAMMRRAPSNEETQSELQELKRLMLQEQGDLRSFIGALRSGREIDLPQLGEELRSLAGKLEKQWDIKCSMSADVPERLIPMRLHLDAMQLVREAVANAVRHGNAKEVRIRLATEDDTICLELQDDGGGFPAVMTQSSGPEDLHPRSLNERVQEAGGKLRLASRDEGTSLTITLPIRGRQ